MIQLIVNYVVQVLATVGLLLLSGKLIALLNSKLYSQLGSRGHTFCIATGFIGTPLHESAHALMCLIFGHKIVEIKFFQPNSADGVLGYVRHSYNEKNIWSRIGNFFIGVAPIIVGYLVLFGLFYLLLPDLFAQAITDLSKIDLLDDLSVTFTAFLQLFVDLFKGAIHWQWWLFVLIGSFIALHMTLSKADLDGAWSGLIFVLGAFAIADIVLFVLSNNTLVEFTKVILIIANFMLFFFCIFLLIAIILCVLARLLRK